MNLLYIPFDITFWANHLFTTLMRPPWNNKEIKQYQRFRLIIIGRRSCVPCFRPTFIATEWSAYESSRKQAAPTMAQAHEASGPKSIRLPVWKSP